MRSMSKLFQRIPMILTLILITLVTVLPLSGSVTAATGPVTPDDFNRCSLNTSLWTVGNPAGFPAPSISGQYTGNSYLTLTVPPGKQAAFSELNTDAPRVMQQLSGNGAFDFEVKFLSPFQATANETWTIQGILIHDTSTQGQDKWLRFELNTDPLNNSIDRYIGYFENGVLSKVAGPGIITTQKFDVTPIYESIRYDGAGGWIFAYKIGDLDSYHEFQFTNDTALEGSPITFTPSEIGVFAGAERTSGTASIPGITSQVDYVYDVFETPFTTNDANTITVNKAGTGQGTVNWPMTNPAQQCSGNVVTLTAQPNPGSTFDGWTGTQSGSQPSIQLTMDKSYTETANFTGGAPINYTDFLYLPLISR